MLRTNFRPAPDATKIKCYRQTNHDKFWRSRGTQNVKLSDANDNGIEHKTKGVRANIKEGKYPICFLDPELCACKTFKQVSFDIQNEWQDIPNNSNKEHKEIKKKPRDDSHLDRNSNFVKCTYNLDGKPIAKFSKKPRVKNKKNNENNPPQKDNTVIGDASISPNIDQIDKKKINKNNKKKNNVGFGDQAPLSSATTKLKLHKDKFLKKIRKRMMQDTEDIYYDNSPLFEIKVDSKNLRVLNPTELRSKVKEFSSGSHVCDPACEKVKINSKKGIVTTKNHKNNNGDPKMETAVESMTHPRTNKNKENDKKINSKESKISIGEPVCVCLRNRGKRRNAFGRKNKYKCKCKGRRVECNDPSCNDNLSNKKRKLKSIQRDPLFQVAIDSSNMNIINTDDIKDIFKNASRNHKCLDGTCREAAKEKHVILKCRCINKKLKGNVIECDDESCKTKGKKPRAIRREQRRGEIHKRVLKEDETDDRKWSSCLSMRRRKPKKKKVALLYDPNISISEQVVEGIERKSQKGKILERSLKKEERRYKAEDKKVAKQNAKACKEIAFRKKTDIGHWNCLSNFLTGIINLTLESIKNILIMVVTIITKPIRSYVYVKEKAKDPAGAMTRMGQWFRKVWGSNNSKIAHVIRENELEAMSSYNVFANKGTTKKGRVIYERKKRMREKRMTKRYNEALYGCQHVLLTTLPKTPCLWFYYFCPTMYPQFLNLLRFMKNFLHILVYLAALACWTPCIVGFELCRGLLCCLFCTG